MKPKIIFLLNSVDIDRGGLTHASLRQASTFADAGYETQILTFNYEARFPIICKKLVELNKVSPNVIIRNMFEDRSGYNKNNDVQTQNLYVNTDELSQDYKVIESKKFHGYSLYKDSLLKKTMILRDDNTLDYIDYFNEKRVKYQRDSFNYYNRLSRRQYYSEETKKIEKALFFDQKKNPILKIWYDPEPLKANRVLNLSSSQEILTESDGDESVHKIHWLKTIVESNNSDTVIISDTRSTDNLLVHFHHERVKKVLRLHSNHLKNPDDIYSGLTGKNKYLIENIQNVDAIAVLTEKQKSDIVERFGQDKKIHVIPNYTEVHVPRITGIRSTIAYTRYKRNYIKTRDLNKVVIVSRFSKLKNITHSIKAFSKVIQHVPEAKLEIWGHGNYSKEYEQEIKKLNLNKSVKLKGYTRKPNKVYQSAAFSLMTSRSEGFSLGVMESMVNGAPVISYDISYGPSDMIIDGENGILVEKGNIDELADKIIYLLQNKDLNRKMGHKARKYINTHFSKKSYQKKWFSLAENLVQKPVPLG